MLIAKGRLHPGADATELCQLVLAARGVRCLPITPEIAACSTELALPHGDPTDRLIAATSLVGKAPLVTADKELRDCADLDTIW